MTARAIVRIEGWATAAGTAAYRAGMGAVTGEHWTALGDLTVSSIGIGTYLGAEDDATDRAYTAAISRALALGINVVDTAVNYRCQRSERSVGAALRSAIAAGHVDRDAIVLATKGGFLPFDGRSPANPGAYLANTYVRSGLARPEEVVGGCHCIAPRYLADQVERSRANLGIATIDVYYVHNPEMQLGAVDRAQFRERMRRAFEFLEGAVREGAIRRYGVATWQGFRQPPSAADHLSLGELCALAVEVAGPDHHFRVLQLPYNLAMTEAFTADTQVLDGETVPLFEAARRLGMYCMTSASIHQGQLARGLPPMLGEMLPGLRSDAQRAVQFARSTPGVGTALVGMKGSAHVEDIGRLCGVAPVAWTHFQRLFQAG